MALPPPDKITAELARRLNNYMFMQRATGGVWSIAEQRDWLAFLEQLAPMLSTDSIADEIDNMRFDLERYEVAA